MTTKSQDKQNKVAEVDESISRIYDFKKRLGKGAYGIVWKALDKRTNQTVAVKKIFDAFRDETDAQRTFREIIFLKEFRNHTNIVSLLNVYKACNNLDIYLVFEYMESDLHNIIKKGTILKDVHKRYVMYQLINAVRFIHSGNVIHRDLKPSNILIDNKCRCKLADFGLARSVATQAHSSGSDVPHINAAELLLTDYVATRWYRAPEILVASKRYTKGIDMWSLGCILGEMLRGKPLFQGSSTVNQIEKIVTALPNITEDEIAALGGGFGTALLNKQTSAERGPTLDELLKDSPQDAFDLVKSLLLLDPLARLNANDAISHAYVQKFRNTSDEIELNVDVLPPFSDDVRLTVQEYREKVYEMSQTSPSRNAVSRLSSKVASHSSKSRELASKRSADSTKFDGSPPRPGSNGGGSKHPYATSSSSGGHTVGGLKASSSLHARLPVTKPKKTSGSSQEKVGGSKDISSGELPDHHSQSKTTLLKKTRVSPNPAPVAQAPPQGPTTTTKAYIKSYITSTNFGSEMVDKYQNTPPKMLPKKGDLYNEPSKVESRGSVDGGYGSLSSESNGNNFMKVSTSPQGTLMFKKSTNDSNTYVLNNGKACNIPYQKNDLMNPNQQQQQYKKVTREFSANQVYNHLEAHRSTPSVVSSNGLNNKTAMALRSTKSEQLAAMGTKKSNASVCYEKRLKKLEEEIEKYKIDVNSFCKQSSDMGRKKVNIEDSAYNQHLAQQQKARKPISSNNYIMASSSSQLKTKLPAVPSEASVQNNSNLISAMYAGQSSSNNHYNNDYNNKRERLVSHHSSKNGSGDYISRSTYNYLPISETLKPMQKSHYHESGSSYSKFRYQYQQAGRPVSVSKII